MGFRQITLSGGEALLIGKRPPHDFLDLLAFMRTLPDLLLHLYTNGFFLTEEVADAMAGVVDEVSITIDSNRDEILQRIGRSTGHYPRYSERAAAVCGRLARRGIRVKLHTVVGSMNVDGLAEDVEDIFQAVQTSGGNPSGWKFYQYMSYDQPVKDQTHAIADSVFTACAEEITLRLDRFEIPLHFKSNQEMNASLFNILPYGNAQYARSGDTWSTTCRTRDLRSYPSLEALFAQHDIDSERFRRFHAL
jgi:molybdenum cofactor biosynthesis enzyme MoaA